MRSLNGVGVAMSLPPSLRLNTVLRSPSCANTSNPFCCLRGCEACRCHDLGRWDADQQPIAVRSAQFASPSQVHATLGPRDSRATYYLPYRQTPTSASRSDRRRMRKQDRRETLFYKQYASVGSCTRRRHALADRHELCFCYLSDGTQRSQVSFLRGSAPLSFKNETPREHGPHLGRLLHTRSELGGGSLCGWYHAERIKRRSRWVEEVLQGPQVLQTSPPVLCRGGRTFFAYCLEPPHCPSKPSYAADRATSSALTLARPSS